MSIINPSSLFSTGYAKLTDTGFADKKAREDRFEAAPAAGKTAPAESAHWAGMAANSSATANTLWQTQSYAQSEESHAADAEEITSAKEPSATDKFLEFINKTPQQLMREAILKDLGYTEEDLDAMDPKERAKVEAKIAELIRKKIEEAMREDGVNIDLVRQVRAGASLSA